MSSNVPSKERERLERITKEHVRMSVLEFAAPFGMWGGILGLCVGFFQSCSIATGSLDMGSWLGTGLIWAIIAGVIGAAIGRIIGAMG